MQICIKMSQKQLMYPTGKIPIYFLMQVNEKTVLRLQYGFKEK